MTHHNWLLSTILNFFYKRVSATNVCFANYNSIRKTRDDIISRLRAFPNITDVHNDEQCDVKVAFCPIVSRAGTDLMAALSGRSDEKPTVMFVLHHTFNPDYTAPNSSGYDRNNLMMVDVLFHEDSGLLNCSKNNKAIEKAGNYLKKYGKTQYKVNVKRAFAVIAVVAMIGIGIWYRTRKGSSVFPKTDPGSQHLDLALPELGPD
ncbi:hypothetical protein PHYPO_G00096320 [Pangasianodon hypophthalmus]|uniref:Uncharacterized protein n=1 Tax=Pangasianodon hypophthalmus TaxID=310915 RepID=A0A5N5LB68_PANHP|nr:hypothetical protein PHYPO_G00096320 [Pangasianodon hypophthalmus]